MRRVRLPAIVAALIAASGVGGKAQEVNRVFNEPSVFDLVLGAHALEQPSDGFVEFACGTNGGPPGLRIAGFHDFARCRPEPSGLYEVAFRYDEEAEFIARARGQSYQVSLFGGTTIYAIAVIVSALFDEGGVLQGFRVVSDPRVSVAEREMAYTLGRFLKARYRIDQADCENLPRQEGERPVGSIFIKESCQAALEAGERVVIQTHHYRRPGQVALDRAGIALTEGQFWSEVRLEVSRTPDADADAATRSRAAGLAPRSPEVEPLVVRARDCPGCDLSGANLKRADLSNANLRGANLAGANLHAAILTGADLTGADLSRANLNRADLRRASLDEANLSRAMAYDGRFEGAMMARANLSGGLMAQAQFTRANLAGANLHYADLRGARFADAVLEGSDMSQTWLEGAVLIRAAMDGVLLDGAILIRAGMRGASLVGASLVDADLYRADLSGADLTRADLRRARMTAVGMRGADLTDMIVD